MNTKTKITFCNVGNGTAVHLRIQNRIDVVFNTGADRKIINCLSKQMPFFDRTIEYLFVTEKVQGDTGGLLYLIERYKVEHLYLTTYSLDSKYTNVILDSLAFSPIIINDDLFLELKDISISLTLPVNKKSSALILISSLNDSVLITGESTKQSLDTYESNVQPYTILQAPHYGSKDRLTSLFLELAQPRYVVISSRKTSSLQYPSEQLLGLLRAMNTEYLITEENGDLSFDLN